MYGQNNIISHLSFKIKKVCEGINNHSASSNNSSVILTDDKENLSPAQQLSSPELIETSTFITITTGNETSLNCESFFVHMMVAMLQQSKTMSNQQMINVVIN